MNIKEIKEILQLMAEHNLTEIEIEKDGIKIKLKKGRNGRMVMEEPREMATVIPVPVMHEAGSEGKGMPESPNSTTVRSPMVGTFYAAPSPDQAPYASPGKKIKEGDVLCIIEAMKLMNEIKAEVTGTVTEVLVKNGQPIEFDQPLFKIQKG